MAFQHDEHVPALESAIRDAFAQWLGEVRDAIIDGTTVNLDNYPDPSLLREALEEHAADVLARVWQHAHDEREQELDNQAVTAAAGDDADDDPDDHLDSITATAAAIAAAERLLDELGAPDGTPATLLTIIQSDLDDATGRVTAGQVAARIEALLDIDGPDTRTRQRTTALEAIIDDPDSTPEQRRRARADLTELLSGIKVEEQQWTGTLRRLTHDSVHSAHQDADIQSVRAWAEASGDQLVKTWLSAEDARVRPTHAEVNGSSVDLDDPFHVGGASLDYPGDPSGPIGERANCRCTLLYETPEEAGVR